MDHGLHPHVTNHRKLLESLGEAPQLPDAHSSTFHLFTRSRSCRSTPRSAWVERSWTCDVFLRGTNRASTPQTRRNILRILKILGLMHLDASQDSTLGISGQRMATAQYGVNTCQYTILEFPNSRNFTEFEVSVFDLQKRQKNYPQNFRKKRQSLTNLEKSYNRMF